MTYLGTPASGKGWYARNPWTLYLYEGVLFVGSGNASNANPNPNAGPVDIWAYKNSAFVSEAQLGEQQISQFRVIGGKLITMGIDPGGAPSASRYFQRESDESWSTHSVFAGSTHTYDIVEQGGLWLAALSAAQPLAVSSDQGASWNSLNAPDGSVTLDELVDDCVNWQTACVGRIWQWFEHAGALYANTTGLAEVLWCDGVLDARNVSPAQALFRWTGSGLVSTAFNPFTIGNRVVRPTKWRDKLVYIEATRNNDHQWLPNALRVAHADLTVETLAPPYSDRVMDVAALDSRLFVLSSKKYGSTWRVAVQYTDDLDTWKEEACLSADAYGRSFALTRDSVYIGLGSDTTATTVEQNATGRIYQLPIEHKRYLLCLSQ